MRRGVRWGAVKNTSEAPDMNICIVCVTHSSDIHSFICTISFYIGSIMLISTSASGTGSMSLFFYGFMASGFIFMVKGHETMDKVMACSTGFPINRVLAFALWDTLLVSHIV